MYWDFMVQRTTALVHHLQEITVSVAFGVLYHDPGLQFAMKGKRPGSDMGQSYPAGHSNLLCVFSAADGHWEFLQIVMPFLIVGS